LDKLKIAVLFGGCSEHAVSVKSAIEVANSINTQKYEPIYIGIAKSGAWKMCEKPCANWESGDCREAIISPDRNTHGLIAIQDSECKTVHIDMVFPVLHGKTGEDGSVQGLLELSGIPYVGCDIQSSVICMDKSLAYIVAKSAGIATPEFSILTDTDKVIPNSLEYPVFVKPARSGSSFGVTKVCNANELNAAAETARQYDSKVLIEQAIVGTEVGCAVLGNGSDLFVGEVDQVSLTHGIFRIHQEAAPEKGSENATITVPANLPVQTRGQIQKTAKAIYTALGCKGLARVDMFLQENPGNPGDRRIVLNEVNTLPGFTSYSRYPRMMSATGITLPKLIDRLIESALMR
jgi:D-alanine--(R)-lactate ligase